MPEKLLSRRKFLENTGTAAAGLALFPSNRRLLTEKQLVNLPEDIVDAETLQNEFSTRVSNTDSVKLFLRPRALTEEPIFNLLRNCQDQRHTLDIILTNGPGIGLEYMRDDQKALLNRQALLLLENQCRNNGTLFFQDKEILTRASYDYRGSIEILENRYAKKEIDNTTFEAEYRSIRSTFRPFLEKPTEEDLIKIGGLRTKGLSISTLDGRLFLIIGAGALPLGDRETPPQKYARFLDSRPPIDKQYISPEEYYQSAVEKRYIYPQSTIWHEFSHFELSEAGILRLVGEDKANYNAGRKLTLASTAMLQDNDDSYYYFILQTDQGIIICDNLSKNMLLV